MASIQSNIDALTRRWLRRRFALPLIVASGAVLLLVSEHTYRATTQTLRGGITLTDARVQSLRLLKAVSDAEAAYTGLVMTGQKAYASRLKSAAAELGTLRRAVTDYFRQLDAAAALSADRVDALTSRLALQFERALEMSDRSESPATLWQGDAGRSAMSSLQQVMEDELARGAAMQGDARISIYDALFMNRMGVGMLTLVTLLSLFLYQRQLKLLDRERDDQRNLLLGERQQLELEVERRTKMLAELATHLQTVREDERSRLARELHDELGSLLTASKLEIARARAKVDDPRTVLQRLERVVGHINAAVALKRRIIEDLRPSALSNLGLGPALEILCRETSEAMGIPIRYSAVEVRLSEAGDLAVYRFVQEALNNASKYAEARSIDVKVEALGDKYAITVRDDGTGFDPLASRVGHHGLSGMAFRAESLGGSMRIESSPAAGTSLTIQLPPSE